MGRWPTLFVERQVSREWGNSNFPANYDYKEGAQTNQCVFFFFLNNDLCLSTIVVIIRKLNSSLACKVTHRNLVISFDNCLLIRHGMCKIDKFLFFWLLHIINIFARYNISIGIWKCKSYGSFPVKMTLLKMLRKHKPT